MYLKMQMRITGLSTAAGESYDVTCSHYLANNYPGTISPDVNIDTGATIGMPYRNIICVWILSGLQAIIFIVIFIRYLCYPSRRSCYKRHIILIHHAPRKWPEININSCVTSVSASLTVPVSWRPGSVIITVHKLNYTIKICYLAV